MAFVVPDADDVSMPSLVSSSDSEDPEMLYDDMTKDKRDAVNFKMDLLFGNARVINDDDAVELPSDYDTVSMPSLMSDDEDDGCPCCDKRCADLLKNEHDAARLLELQTNLGGHVKA